MESALIARIVRWWVARKDRPRPCFYGRSEQHDGPACGNLISDNESLRLHHPGFCSFECAELDHEERLF